MTYQVLLGVALGVWALGAGVDLCVGRPRTRVGQFPYICAIVGGVALTILGGRAVFGSAMTIDLASSLGTGETALRIDPVAGLFLTLTGGLAVVISACLVSWVRPAGRVRGRGTGAGYLLLLGSVTLILVAADAFSFLFAWESLTAAFYVLAGVGRRDRAEVRASWVTLGVGKVSGAALLFGFLLLAGRSGSLVLSAWGGVGPGALRDAAWVLIVVGFGAKVGLVPFQVWLPLGYPAAPGPTRAAMAGLAANAGFYGLWRFLGILGRPPEALAIAVLLLGGATALLGIVFAAVQSQLNRVIAYSSVENAGIILVGYGIALAGATTGSGGLVAIGLLAASLQVLAHAIAKSGLFASAAFFEARHGTDLLDELRGVGFAQPMSGTTFAVASITLAGLPPTIGFVSEWFILESLIQEFRLHDLALRLAMAGAGALVALTVGVATLTFIRLIGLTILGRGERPSPRGHSTTDSGFMGRMGLLALTVFCLAPALLAPLVFRYIARGLAPFVAGHPIGAALKSPWVVQPIFASFSSLSPSWLFVAMPIGFLAVTALAILLSNGRLLKARRVPAWRSATAGTIGTDRYTSFGYANIARHVLGNILGARRAVERLDPGEHHGVAGPVGLVARSTLVEPVERYLYRPGRRVLLWSSAQVRRLQSGRLDAYIAYMLVSLLVLLAVVAIIG